MWGHDFRQGAAACLRTVAKSVGETGSSTSSITWAREKFTPKVSPESGRLTIDQSQVLLNNVVLPSIEECVLDGSNISRVLKTALTSKSPKSDLPTTKPKHMKSSEVLVRFLTAHALDTPILRVQIKFLSMLAQWGKSSAKSRELIVFPILESWVEKPWDEAHGICMRGNVSLGELDSAFMENISSKDHASIDTRIFER